MSSIKVYHGSYCEVQASSLSSGRSDADFGIGFYVTHNFSMAEKWASRKKPSIINEYELDTTNLCEYRFQLDKEWLDFVIQNRNGFQVDDKYSEYDLLIGATADDKLFSTLEQYESGLIDAITAVKALNCMEVGEQICICTEKALNALKFARSVELQGERLMSIRMEAKVDRKLADELTSKIIRESIARKNNEQSLDTMEVFK